jgi:hypothetical protein
MAANLKLALRSNAFLIAATALIPLVGLQLSCSSLRAANDRLQVSWTELSAQAGGAKGAVQLTSGAILATRTEWHAGETTVVCSRSTDAGEHWQDISVIARGRSGADLGDGHLVQIPDGAVLFSYRDNQPRTNETGLRRYSIRTAISRDAGQTWQPHSVVAESVLDPAKEPEALRGLWSSFLLRKRDGTLQCYYDDEDTPHRAGFFRHQWITMRTWDANSQQWVNPVTVSRAHERQHLSRDGMASIVELPSGQLLCVLESVHTAPPHANCIRLVSSDDGGRTWSWQHQERRILFQTSKPDHLAVSPWAARLPDGPLLCVFATDEDQPLPTPSGTHPRHLKTDLKCVFSLDQGHSWSQAADTIFAGKHHSYVPGVLPLRDGSLLVTCQDSTTGGHRSFRGANTLAALATAPSSGRKLPKDDLAFLRDMTRDVVEASRVKPGSNGGGRWPLTNSCGFSLITPGKDTYTAFWVRDFSMSVDSGFITAEELRDHLLLICRAQNGPAELKLAHGLHVPAWAIPDHINYDGRPTYYPGTYASGQDQGAGACGRVPPIDDHYEFVHIAHTCWKVTRDTDIFEVEVNGATVFERLEKAFACPTIDPATGLARTTETDRAVGFGFCDGETHTGKLLFASLLRYRAAGELAELAKALGYRERVAGYRQIQATIRANVARTFGDPKRTGGWLRASTELSGQADVWGTLFALHLGVLDRAEAAAARKTIAAAVRSGTITLEGGVRQVPTDLDFSKTTAWERSMCAINTYQNGAYWHTASGWLIEALWKTDRPLALQVFREMLAHLRAQDFRKGPGHGAPWEVYGPNGQARQNPVYMASVALPYGILKHF